MRCLLAFLLALTPAAFAQGWTENGRLVPPRANQAGSGSFAIMQIATKDPAGLVAAWNKPGPGASLQGASTVAPGEHITTFLVFRGCTPDPAGNCWVTADFAITGPDGQPSGVPTAVPVWRGPGPAQAAGFQLATTGFGLRFDGGDTPGAYRVRATITDQVAKLTLRTEDVLTLRGE